MAFTRMLWVTETSDFNIKVSVKIRKGHSPSGFDVTVKPSIRNFKSGLDVNVKTSIKNYNP